MNFRFVQQKMALGLLFFLIIQLHLVVGATHFHGYEANNQRHSRSHTSIALPPSKSSYGVPASIAVPPSKSSSKAPTKEWTHGFVDSPILHHRHHHYSRRKSSQPTAPEPTYSVQPPTYSHQGPSVFQPQPPFSSPQGWKLHAPAPSPAVLSNHLNVPSPSPGITPQVSPLRKMKAPPKKPVLSLPPPPPNKDCLWVSCSEPFTYAPPGSPCGCVWPLKIKLRVGVSIYKFFPLVSKLAEEIAASISLNHNQVRIVGADEANQQLGKTIVLINLVPTGSRFDNATAFSIYKKFWHREVHTDASLFGVCEVLNVHYPGLPPSPPSIPSNIDSPLFPGDDNNGTMMKPLGVAIPRDEKKGSGKIMILVFVLSSFTASIIFAGFAWLCLRKFGPCVHESKQILNTIPSSSKLSGSTKSLPNRSMPEFGSTPLSSRTITYTGSAKTFTLNDIEKATYNFDASRILGEGGFGPVYRGVLYDGRDVAVKILKRDDRRGGQEFLAEVEMLGRLHHRNLVKLIGICIENQTRCLVYELVPNGSVESHLHGADKATNPLDWNARMKIALGAARALAYLHEDSNPCVIHRDFKSSNILLEHDFTPKVSDFGLARTAMDEGNKHISTHVMGTFGYLAPEYAMTGHVLVKSDVYSYGVVLLELLTGRKPVDFSQPPGQENLVSWVRPLLTSKEGLEMIIDPVIKPEIPVDSVVKVAAIASMCIQLEVSQRPFMGEVVQALKLVCSELEETRTRKEGLQANVAEPSSRISGEIVGFPDHETKLAISASEIFSTSGQCIELFRRQSASGPLTTGKKKQFWQKLKSLSRGSMSEHGSSAQKWSGSQ